MATPPVSRGLAVTTSEAAYRRRLALLRRIADAGPDGTLVRDVSGARPGTREYEAAQCDRAYLVRHRLIAWRRWRGSAAVWAVTPDGLAVLAAAEPTTRRPRRKRARPEHASPWPWLAIGGYDAINGGIVQAATIGEPDWLGRVPVTLALLLPAADYIPDGLRELATAPPHDDGREPAHEGGDDGEVAP